MPLWRQDSNSPLSAEPNLFATSSLGGSGFRVCLLFCMNRGQWVRGCMGNLWTLGGLSLWELIRRTPRESWEDSVFGQGGRMAFYHFLAIFPSFIISARLPYFRDALLDLSRRIMPEQASTRGANRK